MTIRSQKPATERTENTEKIRVLPGNAHRVGPMSRLQRPEWNFSVASVSCVARL
jgi:hypothetical protein